MGKYGNSMAKLRKLLDEISQIGSAIAGLSWDMEVNVPEAGNDGRAKIISYLSGLAHEKLTSGRFQRALRDVESDLAKYGELIGPLADVLAEGNFVPLLAWLRENVHKHGKRYLPEELIVRACVEPPGMSHFTSYLEKKYSEIYGL